MLKAGNNKRFLEMLESCQKELPYLMVPSIDKINTWLSELLHKYKKKEIDVTKEIPNSNSEGEKDTKSMHKQHQ